jgi:hypothetical protein
MQPHDELRSLLNDVRRRWRSRVVLRLAGRASLAASVPLLAALVLASAFQPRDGILLVVVGALVVSALAAAFHFLRRIGHRPSDVQIARFVEERVADPRLLGSSATVGAAEPLDDVLVSAVGGVEDSAPGFKALVVRTAVRRLRDIGADWIVPTRVVVRSAGEAAGGLAVLGVSLVLTWPLLARASETAWVSAFPQLIQVEVLPGDTRVAAGKPLTIRATVRRGGKLLNRFNPSLTVTAGADERTVPMSPDAGAFTFAFESVDRTFRYHVSAGAARSKDYTVTALVGARVERIDLRYEYPAFTAQPPRDEADGGDIYAPAGTKVRLRVHTDKPISTGSLALDGSRSAPLQRISDRLLEAELVLARDDSYRVGLTDHDGLRSSDDTEYFIRVMADRPPDVRIVRPGGDQQITPLEEVAIEARAEDDHGISRFELVYAVAGREPKVVPFPAANGAGPTRLGSHLLAAEDLRVQPGDVISYYARARDVARGKRSSEARSDMFFLEVRPFSEEFVSAQSQGLAGMAGDQIESLIAAQKDIIAATWNIERRAASGAGRSSADVAAIAAAQAELKGRAEQIVSRGGRGRRAFPMPQQIRPSQAPRGVRPSADPVGSAISAMGRALDQLNGARTGDALPHEMAALQGLLQAQAEIRRREVAQQAGAAGAGMGRQGQDLSALFDKELQRQQRTNYETRSQLEERPERDGETALDRIRELARRQEELSKRQRDLAAADLAPDERKRRLETLMREQTTLREQAEEMARQMGQQSGQPQARQEGQQQGSSSEGRAGGSEMRGASEQMRNAADDLQRQDPAGAAERAAQAAARLRSLERRMQQDSPEARERAAGELRLEAQQIADEQRRIASEASRLEKGKGADVDAWRRLAGEKDALADRVDELKRSAERLSAAAKQDQQSSESTQAAAGAREAAREIDQQRIPSRMREGAKQMRPAPGARDSAGRSTQAGLPKGVADAEQQVARALDHVVDRLGGGSAAGAEDLTRELDEAQALRERLDALERRIREAEAKGQRAASRRSGGQGSELGQLREQYAKEVQRAREALSRVERGAPGAGLGGATPEDHEWSVTDQGTEAFKQDFARWESLRKDVDSALERYERSVVARAARKGLEDRLSGGGSDRVPEAYRKLIARYYESLARKK